MDSSLLEKFRQQLAAWIETRLESQRLPFQRLELCPRTLTTEGRLTPDMVLWINRDSQLAGSMILLPVTVNEKTLTEGHALANALGLGHFTTWAAREVTIWGLASGTPEKLNSFFLPSANHISPQDFQDTLDELLEQLKFVTVTSAPAMTAFSTQYFANLCLRNLHELTPGLTISARVTAGQTAADSWVEQAPRDKAWLSLWRILFLLWQGRLPPGLQPERLEEAICYALQDLTQGNFSWLSPQEDEPPLPEDDAVRLYHLSARLRQLGWPQNESDSSELIWLLLNEAAHRFGVEPPSLPWPTSESDLCVFSTPAKMDSTQSVIAPRAYLAGWELMSSISGRSINQRGAETLQSLGNKQNWPRTTAVFKSARTLDRKQRETALIQLRHAWPNRRFNLPRNIPAWLYDALFLAGATSEELSLTLPDEWYIAPGVDELWKLLQEDWSIAEMAVDVDGMQSLRMTKSSSRASVCRIHRQDQITEIPTTLNETQMSGTTQVWLKGDHDIISNVVEKMTCGFDEHWPEEQEQLQQGAHLYLQTSIGSYLWNLCSNAAPMPEESDTIDAILAHGVPVPDKDILSELAMTTALHGDVSLTKEFLNNEFKGLFGPIPDVVLTSETAKADAVKVRRNPRISSEQISTKVFRDGVPRFPEHYLMEIYRPELTSYDLHGPMEITTTFFDRISLKTIDQEHTIEVSGTPLAEALILASYGNRGEISLPSDEQLLAQIVQQHRVNLQGLWDGLIRECRRVAPLRQNAVKLAKRIWQEHNLPPLEV